MSVLKRQSALQDLDSIVAYLSQHSEQAALRFLDRAEYTFSLLSSYPEIGAAFPCQDAGLQGLRHFQVSGFRNYIIFYKLVPNGIEVWRVLHGARDLPKVLAEG